jgi:hypothetical protein
MFRFFVVMNIFKKLFVFSFIFGIFAFPFFLHAEKTININATSLLPKAELFITPRSGNFLVNSTFEVPIYIDTQKNNINAISVKINFDPKKLAIIKPSGGKSIFGIWVEPPTYDNKIGTVSLAGVIPGGITTSSGLIATMTFKVLASGTTTVKIIDYSSANLNDGLGSEVRLTLTGATYTLSPVPPEGVFVSSETHPSQDRWYNNNSPILNWEREKNEGFSTTLDSSPQVVLANTISTNNSSLAYENLKDGIWYFHVKAIKERVWGNTSNFQIKIDTTPPAEFTPTVNTIKDSGDVKKYLLSFFTTDTLSGIDHYEVGVVDKKDEAKTSPVFIETESPYLIPLDTSNSIKVIIRAFDTAGNLRESSLDLYPSYTTMSIVKKYIIYILSGFIMFLLIELLVHFLFGHHIIFNLRKAYRLFKKISSRSDKITSGENSMEIENINPTPMETTKIEIKTEVPEVPSPPQNRTYFSYPPQQQEDNISYE